MAAPSPSPHLSSPPSDGRNLPAKPFIPSPPSWSNVTKAGKATARPSRVTLEEISKLRAIFNDKISISKEAIEEASKPWRCALTGHFIGRQRDTDFVARSLGRQWQTAGDVEIIPMTDGFFTFRFSCEDDMMKVWTGGPWTVGGMVLSLEQWKSCFRPSREAVPKAAVWLRLPKLPLELMTREWVLSIAARAGTPIDVDVSTKNLRRGTFARACIEIDLSQPLVPGVPIQVEGEPELWQEFIYERIGIYCFQCGRIGHRQAQCTHVSAGQAGVAHIDGALNPSQPLQPPNAKPSSPKSNPVNPSTSAPDHAHSSSSGGIYGPWLVVPNFNQRRRAATNNVGRSTTKSGLPSSENHRIRQGLNRNSTTPSFGNKFDILVDVDSAESPPNLDDQKGNPPASGAPFEESRRTTSKSVTYSKSTHVNRGKAILHGSNRSDSDNFEPKSHLISQAQPRGPENTTTGTTQQIVNHSWALIPTSGTRPYFSNSSNHYHSNTSGEAMQLDKTSCDSTNFNDVFSSKPVSTSSSHGTKRRKELISTDICTGGTVLVSSADFGRTTPTTS